jgi:cytoskeletal protein CcmA (bactofilin family)
VNSYFSVTCFLLLTSGLVLLPLLPALWELHRKSDALPLNIIQQHAGEIRYFADSFRTYLKTLEPALEVCGKSGQRASGIMPDGTEYLILGSGNDALALPLSEKERLCPVLLASADDLSVSGNSTFSKDVYSRGRFVGGANNSYRALLADKETHLGKGSTVVRWLHSGGELSADSACKLHGRISSDARIRLAPGCTFLRLNAPRIELGRATTSGPAQPPSDHSSAASALTPPQRLLHDGDFEIQPGEVFQGNLVVRGNLRIGSGARVFGSVKSEQDLTVETGVRVEGSIICGGKLLVGRDSLIRGPVIAEREVLIQEGTLCGTAETPTTVSAPHIEIVSGVTIFGSLWAREYGEVMASI